jgi:hypothetical protein
MNAQVGFWLRGGHLAERNLGLNYQQIMSKHFFGKTDSSISD